MNIRTNNSEKQKYWQQHIALWQQSGQNKREYCRNNGLSYDQFKWWYAKLQENNITSLSEGFVELSYQQSEKAAHIGIEINGIRVEIPAGIQKQTLVTVLMAVKEALCA